MIKNAITYNVEMPTSVEMEKFASEYEAVKPSSLQISTIGFTTHPVTKQVVSKFHGGYCLTVLRWEKKIDRAAFKEALQERIANHESFGRILSRKEKLDLKDEVVLDMLPGILPSPKYTFAYYHESSNTLIIDSGNSKDADNATSLMRKAIGSLKATTLYIDTRIGLTSSLRSHLAGDSEFINENITLGNTLELNSSEGKVKFTGLDLTDESTSQEIIEQISSGGMFIKTVELECGAVRFNLTNEFKLKSIKYEFEADKDDDKNSQWLAESFACVASIIDITDQLVSRFQVVDK